MKLISAIAVAIALAGCKSVPTVYNAPDAAPLLAAQQRATEHVAKAHAATVRAKVAVGKAKAAHGQAKHFHTAEGVEIKAMQAALDVPAFLNAPPELRDAIDAVQAQVTLHAGTHEQTASAIGQVGQHLEESNSAVNVAEFETAAARQEQQKIATTFGPEYLAKVNDLAAKATADSDKLAKAENELRDLKRKNWIRRALEAVAAIVILVGGFLWFTGKLSLATVRAAR